MDTTPARSIPSATQLEGVQAIDTGITEVERETSRRWIAFGLRHTGGPKQSQKSMKLRNLLPGVPIMMYSSTTKDGNLISIRQHGRRDGSGADEKGAQHLPENVRLARS